VYLTGEAASSFDGSETSSFITYEFFEHEIQATPVMKGNRMDFNFTSLYVVKVDDFFLHYLQKESTMVELHRALGSSYETVAVCQLKLRELLERSHGRLHGTAKLIGTQSSNEGTEVATMEYWVRLRVPMEQAIRLFKERSKALGYLNARDYKALEKTGDELPSDVNELFITITRCSDLNARREDVQPSPYVVYRFYDFADHDTDIISNSNNPQWNDRKTCPVPMTEELDTYLRSQSLEVYVLDDVDPEPTAYLGLAKIPLISLAHGKSIKGTFHLLKESGEKNGTIDVSMEWRNTYLPASAKVKTEPQYMPIAQEEIDHERALAEQPEEKRSSLVPLVTSTPKQSYENVVKKPPKARPRSGKKKPSRPSSAKSLNEENLGLNEIFNDAKDIPANRDEEIEFHKDMSIDQLIQASEEVPKVVEDVPRDVEEKKESQLSSTSAMVAEVPDSEDTMFADEETDSGNNEDKDTLEPVSRELPEELVSGSEGQASDSDGLVMSSMSVHGAGIPQGPAQVTIMVSSLTLYPDTTVMNNDAITELYVAYKFLNCDPAELETPVSLPKPAPNRPIHYNFKKVFPVDSERNEVKRSWLVHTISSENPEQG
ncbi:fantom-like isoform X1, partial [Paramuricea clavata]